MRFAILRVAVCASVLLACLSASAGPSLVGLWRFDETNGVTAKDSSGLGHDGTLVGENGNVPTRVSGQTGHGGALQFGNNGSDRSYVDVPGSPSLMIGLTATNTWTIAVWAYEASDGAGGYVANYGRFMSQDGGNGIEWDSGATGDDQYYVWHHSLNAWHQGFGTDATVVPLLDQWIHLALVYNGTNLTLYRNANQGALGAMTSVAVNAALAFPGYKGGIQIAGELDISADRNWNGMLDDFAVFDGALAPADLAKIMGGDFSAYISGGPPKIVVEPADTAVNKGLDATLSVGATSQTPVSYQWRFNGSDLNGATNSTLALTNVQPAQAGTYSVMVSNASGSAPSRNAYLVVLSPLPPRLAGLWRFDEGSGTTAHDSSGLTNDGTLSGDNGAAPSWVAGQAGFGQALQFQNDGTDRSYVDVAASDSLKIGLTSNDTWTLALWAYEASDGSGNYVADYGRFLSQDGGAGMEWDSGANGDSQYYFWHNSITEWQQGFGVSSAVTPAFDNWVHLALVYDGRNLTLYKNGGQGGSASVPVNASLNYPGYAGALQIGSELDIDASRTWNGMLDDVAVFDGALNETQLKTVMSGDFSAFLNTSPLLALEQSGGKIVVSWGYGILQTANGPGGAWQDQAALTSPLIIDASSAQQFYRVRR